ncbi:uncharacterized protein EV420DRAFT_1480650 [Desarmillaria tabescens]|uniref:F-box domain-containing protein n=1 Tax=Armillaria tabescens TaxID=1929756 RepID=A0AA39KAH7_ARMTA|nr:uncharacterized protein EV420DRAFT_1480650 [Desarmillaria tabescens]KAK0457589.1 hypothetical protein EV420DRAFT_1480650 [Desarmillaria tabescens]
MEGSRAGKPKNHAGIERKKLKYKFLRLCRNIRTSGQNSCQKCAFHAVHPYIPSVNVIDLLRSGFSSLDDGQASVLNDIAKLEQELGTVESLLIQIRDRRNKILKDLGDFKSLLGPIRRLPRETLLHIFNLVSSDIPDPLDAPWILGQVCSTWRSISRSCPSLWTRITIPEDYDNYPAFLKEYISLSRDLPVHLSIEEYPGSEMLKALEGLLVHSERWSTLELTMIRDDVFEYMSLAAYPAIQLTKLSIYTDADIRLESKHVVFNSLFSSSPIREAHFEDFPYLRLPINMAELRKLFVYSYDPTELHCVLRRAQHLIEISVTPTRPPRNFSTSSAYTPVIHTSIERLSLVMTHDIHRVTKFPISFDSVTLPALCQFDILTDGDKPLFQLADGTFQDVEYSRMLDLFRRSECNLTILILSIPVYVESFLVPILMQSPALQKLDIFIDASVAKDVFKVLALQRGLAQQLEELCIEEAPFRTAKSSLLEEEDEFHQMFLSRSVGNRRLETLRLVINTSWCQPRLPLPVGKESSFRDLFRFKDEGMDIKFLLDGKDCLVDKVARVRFFGSSSTYESPRFYP